MDGRQLKGARQKKGWSQQEAAKRLGVSQGYLSLLEGDRRNLPAHLFKAFSKAYKLSPLSLPFRGESAWPSLNADALARELAGLGYPGFSYMKAKATWNPAELLVAALTKDNLDSRDAEALPWVALKYHDMDWQWVMKQSKLLDAQNRLGFAVTLAREAAERKSDSADVEHLRSVETSLQSSRLARMDTFCHENMTQSERKWLQKKRTPQARRWNLLSDLAPEHLTHVDAWLAALKNIPADPDFMKRRNQPKTPKRKIF